MKKTAIDNTEDKKNYFFTWLGNVDINHQKYGNAASMTNVGIQEDDTNILDGKIKKTRKI